MDHLSLAKAIFYLVNIPLAAQLGKVGGEFPAFQGVIGVAKVEPL
jgi:hypothetical protein